jgi:hypothetical protein
MMINFRFFFLTAVLEIRSEAGQYIHSSEIWAKQISYHILQNETFIKPCKEEHLFSPAYGADTKCITKGTYLS